MSLNSSSQHLKIERAQQHAMSENLMIHSQGEQQLHSEILSHYDWVRLSFAKISLGMRKVYLQKFFFRWAMSFLQEEIKLLTPQTPL